MTTEAQAIADLATKASGPHDPRLLDAPGGRTLLFRPLNMIEEDVSDPTRKVERPGHIRQEVTLQTVDSLVDYVNGFKTSTTVLFADIALNRIVALIDYHEGSDGGSSGEADHLFHRATLALPYSEEWKTWAAVHGKLVGQREFACFLEENAADVAAPSGADLLDTVRDLHAIRKVNFKKAVRTTTEHENFEYSEETEARSSTGGVEVPTKFLLRLPVYFGDAPTELYAFLRWKLAEGSLTLGVALHRAEHVRQAVFKQIVQDVSERAERPAMFGKAV